jgi:hypothetical protein
MTDQHRATPEQWEYQERWASDDDDASCILELRCRVEALERQSATPELRAASAEVRPTVKDSLTGAGGLVERVAMAANCYPHENACAAIRAVAAWLRDERQSPMTADVLEQEADRG